MDDYDYESGWNENEKQNDLLMSLNAVIDMYDRKGIVLRDFETLCGPETRVFDEGEYYLVGHFHQDELSRALEENPPNTLSPRQVAEKLIKRSLDFHIERAARAGFNLGLLVGLSVMGVLFIVMAILKDII